MKEDVSYLGWWCLDERSKLDNCKSYPGELRVSSNSRITLKLMGEPKEIKGNIFRINEQENHPIIIGYAKNTNTNKDHTFTLINSTVSGYRSSGLTEVELTASQLLIDHQIESLKDFKVGYLSLHIRFLEEWVGQSGFKRRRPNSSEEYQVNLEYVKPKSIPLSTNDKFRIDVKFAATAPLFPLLKNVTISERALIVIEFKRRQKISYVLDLIEKIENFFTFAIGEPVPIDSIEMKLHSYKQMKRKKIGDEAKFQLIRKENKRYTSRNSIKERQMLIPLRIMAEKCPKLISLWMDSYDQYKHALNLYFGKIYSKSQYEENGFLDIVYSLEVLHRIQNPNFNGKNAKYDRKLSRIAGQLKQNDREWIIRRLGNKHEKTLLNRFDNIYQEIRPVLKTIFKNPKASFEQVVTTRNYLVHYEILPQFRKKVIPSNILYRYTNRLTVVFQALMIYYMTGNIELVIERIDKSTINKIFIRYKEN